MSTIIKANSGFYVATYLEGDAVDPHCFVLQDVLAWDIERGAPIGGNHYYCVTPITIEGNPDSSSNVWLVKKPDGSFDSVLNESFDTEEKALNWAKAKVSR